MDPRTALTLLEHCQWADERVLEAAARADAAQFTREVSVSPASLRDTLVHVLWAEELWLARWHGRSPRDLADPSGWPDVASLRARWSEVHRGQRAFVEALGPADLAREVSYVNARGERWTYALWQMIHHALTHSHYHRGQAALLLRLLGLPAVTTDFLVFVDERAAAGR